MMYFIMEVQKDGERELIHTTPFSYRKAATKVERLRKKYPRRSFFLVLAVVWPERDHRGPDYRKPLPWAASGAESG